MNASEKQFVQFRSEISGDDGVKLIIAGRLDSTTTGTVWRDAMQVLARGKAATVIVDASGVEYCDGAGIALLIHLRHQQSARGGQLEIHGLHSEFQELLHDITGGQTLATSVPIEKDQRFAEQLGQAVVELLQDIRVVISFVGELFLAMAHAARHPRRVRWLDTLKIAEALGVDALPIILLIGFLMGLIMAFQAAIPLGQFGAQIFVANLIGLAILRELGPLMTAIVLAGRSGSAFAAEIGTKKVREEIDALKTMGLEPVRFLVVPRVIAALVMTPLLTVFADLVGLMGGAVVLLSLGFPLITFFHQLQSAVSYGSPVGGLVKSFFFGILVAAIGCLRGLQTKNGASAVGESTTRAVVSAIVLIVITDGIFSVIYYYLWV
ncbi:MAG: MlaE family lipid ABC transporter permease subunit [Deltaproteobacteria bacterium]|nr:MlaE family lipid ABC transporter permease subunit [Deltaproteobacteria bacterium]